MKNMVIYLMAFFAVLFVSTSCKKEKDAEPERFKVLVMGAVPNENYLVLL